MPINRDYNQFLLSFGSSKFQQLRNSQAYILQEYATKYASNPDVAIELPTGAGKTLIALLIAEAWRQDGRKVAILSANKTLARQMLGEATALGIPAILMEGRGTDIPAPDKRAYQRANKVAIMNYWVYFNQNPVIDPADLLVMDDAHLAEHCLHSLYSVEINRHNHKNLFISLITELQARFPEYSVLTDAISGDVPLTNATELLSFIDQISVSDLIRSLIDTSSYLDSDMDLRFRWGRVRNNIREANIYMSLNSIWIRPYIYPLLANTYYLEVSQRLYTSATIGDPGDLSRRLGVRPITKIPVPQEFSEKTSGRRLVVMNRIEDEDIPERLGIVILSALKIHPKSVWLCSSESDAQKYQKAVTEWLKLNEFIAHPTWLLTPLGDEIDQFKGSSKGHLFVGGRFDGMDFKADECRLVILTTLPRAINPQEEFISTYLRDSGFMLRRLNHRVIQALGRCNRSDDDFGVYILADRRFATRFGRESNKEGLPRNIIAEIDMAQDDAEIKIGELVEKVKGFLQKDFSKYDKEFQAYISEVPAIRIPPTLTDTSEDEVIGWTSLFNSHNYEIAASRFEKCWNIARQDNLMEITALYGWQWAKALFLQSNLGEPSARERALMVFENAIKRGGSSSWFNRMRASLYRANEVTNYADEVVRNEYSSLIITTFDEYLERLGTTGDKFVRWRDSITSLLRSESHAQYQEGLEKLGKILSYTVSRPKYGSATDCRWRGVFGNIRELITFEAKIEQDTGHEITSYHLGQAHNQQSRTVTEYESQGYTVRGTIVTHLSVFSQDAEASIGTIKIIPKSTILSLWDRISLLLSLYRDGWSLYNIPGRISAAQSIRGRLPATGWLIRALDGESRFVSSEQILSEWS
jgi:hypothetical protein